MKKVCALIFALILLLAAAACAESVLNVNGSGTVMVEADMASISLGVSMMGPDLTELQQQVNGTVKDVCAALVAQGVDEKNIATNYLYIYPQYDYSSEVAQLVGYSVNNNMTIVTDNINSVGELIDASFAAGANSFDSITFSVKDETLARNQALELAVRNAFEKAEVIAKASGKVIEGILSIDESGLENNNYSNAAGAKAEYAVSDSAAAGTTVHAAQIAVTANVKITFEIR